MYQGSVQDIPSYFGQRNHPCPPNYNPAGWIMNVALSRNIAQLENDGFFPSDDRENFEAIRVEEHDMDSKDALGITGRGGQGKNENYNDNDKVGIVTQTILLFQHEVANLLGETHALKARLGMTCMISGLIGCLYYQIAQSDFTEFINVQSTFGA